MSRKCCVRTCRELSAKSLLNGDPQPKAFKFPRDHLLRARWDLFVNQANHTVNFRSSGHDICARHFQATCFDDRGKLIQKSVPTITDRFTLETAVKYHVTRELGTTDLNVINNFQNSVLQVLNSEPQQVDENALPNVCPVPVQVGTPVSVQKDLQLTEPSKHSSSSIESSNNIVSQDQIAKAEPQRKFMVSTDTGEHSGSDIDSGNSSSFQHPISEDEDEINKELDSSEESLFEMSPVGSPVRDFDQKLDTGISPGQRDTLSTPTTEYGISRIERSLECKRVTRYSSSEVLSEHFTTPRQRRANVDRVNKKLTVLRRRLKTQRQKCARYRKKIRSLEELIAQLKEKNLLSHDLCVTSYFR